jgi:hypothetical protein
VDRWWGTICVDYISDYRCCGLETKLVIFAHKLMDVLNFPIKASAWLTCEAKRQDKAQGQKEKEGRKMKKSISTP